MHLYKLLAGIAFCSSIGFAQYWSGLFPQATSKPAETVERSDRHSGSALKLSNEKPVIELLAELGVEKPAHYVATDSITIRRGYELVHAGRTTAPDGSRSKPVSKFYSCTSCHNVVREDPDLTRVDPEARLHYAMKNDIPYLQGSTFWGIVNRESWYNDDYVLKYGDLVKKAKNSLRESVQLCARVCAQGRTLEEWEMKSILAYFRSLEITLGDLEIDPAEKQQVKEFVASGKQEAAIALIKDQYMVKSPATFGKPPKDKAAGYEEIKRGRLEEGKAIYDLGCKHCHHAYGESDLVLDDSRFTFKWLVKHIPDNGDLSIYEITRVGTYSEKGHKEYMPHYTLEKMSHQQLEDLRTYMEANQ